MFLLYYSATMAATENNYLFDAGKWGIYFKKSTTYSGPRSASESSLSWSTYWPLTKNRRFTYMN